MQNHLVYSSTDTLPLLRERLQATGADLIELYMGCGHGIEMRYAYQVALQQGTLARKLFIGVDSDEKFVADGIASMVDVYPAQLWRDRILIARQDILKLRSSEIGSFLLDLPEGVGINRIRFNYPEGPLGKSLAEESELYELARELLAINGTLEIITDLPNAYIRAKRELPDFGIVLDKPASPGKEWIEQRFPCDMTLAWKDYISRPEFARKVRRCIDNTRVLFLRKI